MIMARRGIRFDPKRGTAENETGADFKPGSQLDVKIAVPAVFRMASGVVFMGVIRLRRDGRFDVSGALRIMAVPKMRLAGQGDHNQKAGQDDSREKTRERDPVRPDSRD
jgi:hypothetical protein